MLMLIYWWASDKLVSAHIRTLIFWIFTRAVKLIKHLQKVKDCLRALARLNIYFPSSIFFSTFPYMHISASQILPVLYIMCSVNQDEHIQPDGCYHSERAAAAALLTNASSPGKMRVKDHLYLMLHRSSGAFSAPTWPPQLTHTCSPVSDKHTNAFWRLALCWEGDGRSTIKCRYEKGRRVPVYSPAWMVDAQASSSPAL